MTDFPMVMIVVISPGVTPPGTGEGGGTKPQFNSDTDHLSEGDSGEAQDRAGCN